MNATLLLQRLQQPEFRLGLGLAVASFVLWRVPVLGWLLYPFYLFGVFIHELSHGFAALLTGGRFQRFVIRRNRSGLATVSGGVGCVVASAGYLGSALAGGLLLVIAMSDTPSRKILLILGILLGLLCLLFVRNLFGMVAGLGLACALILAGQRLDEFWTRALLWFLAVQLFLYTFARLFNLLEYSAFPGDSDAHVLAKQTGIHAAIWLLIWLLITVGILVIALNRAYAIPLPWPSQLSATLSFI
jgi:hypothetical protein